MASVDVPVALLGYGTVGAAVHRLLEESADEIERATGHRLRVTRALVRDTTKDRGFSPEPGVLTDDFATIRDDPAIQVVAEVMGGVDPSGGYVLELLRSGRPVVTANKQLVARRGADLFEAAAAGGVQLRFEASVCAAIPVIKVLRESLVVTNVHRVLGIVNGTTNFILSAMEGGRSYEDALAEAQRLGFAEADPTEDVGGLDAAAKTAILATVAFGSRVPLDWVDVEGIEGVTLDHVTAARALDMHVKLIGRATLVGDRVDVRVGPAFVDRHHPLAAVEGAFNAVMLQGDAIREITLEGPGRGQASRRRRPWSPTWCRSSARPAPASCRTTRSGGRWSSSRQASSSRRSTCASRSRIARACWPGSRRSSLRRGSRWPASCSSPPRVARSCTWSRTRPLPVASTPRSRRSGPGRVARGRERAPVVSDRGVAELGWA